MRFFLLVILSLAVLSGAAYAQDSWALTDQSVPTAMTWDQTAGATVDASNDGTTTWDTTYSLTSVADVGPAAAAINRWGLTTIPLTGSVAPGADFTFDFSVVAPPITTLKYNIPFVPTAPGVIEGFDNNFQMANAGTLITTDTAENATTILRFPDLVDDPGTTSINEAWANFQIEELAGLVPMVVGGYSTGEYRPMNNVTRGNMAVFMKRALQLADTTYVDGTFTDVDSTYPAANEIQACVDAGIVQGFANGTYRPSATVTRGSMAIYVARGLAGGDEFVPSGPSTPSFTDVGTGDQPYKYVEYAVSQGVVQGYANGTYRPLVIVNRASMAVFVYRAFVQNADKAVVLGGPAITAENPATTSYVGWTSKTALAPDTGNAYVVFDAVRLGDDLVGTDGTFDVKFAFVPETGPTQNAIVSIDATEINAAHDAAVASGDPYFVVSTAVPTLATGNYTLQVFCTDEDDVYNKAGRDYSFSIVSGASGWLTAAWGKQEAIDTLGGAVDDSTASAGYNESDMATSDDVYFRSQRNSFPSANWCNWDHAHALVWHNIPASASSLTVQVEYRVDLGQVDCCTQWGTLGGDWELPTPAPTEHVYPVPAGWGLRAMGGDNRWQMQWWDTINNSDPVELEPDASGDTDVPAENDVQCGFTGHPTTDTAFTWTVTNPASYLTADGDFLLVFCGGGYEFLYVDQAVLQWVP